MGKFLKYLFYTIFTLAVLAMLGIGILVYTINPNSLKGPLIQQVKAETGRNLTISGDISWRFFPWLGFSIQGIQLSNPNNFAAGNNFLSLTAANVDIKVLPLLSGNIEIGKVSMDGLKLNLMTNAQGQNNWTILPQSPVSTGTATATASPTTNSSSSKIKLGTLKVSAIDITNASVSYNNLKTNQNYVLQNFNLASQNISLNSAFPVEMGFTFNSTAPNVNGQVNVDTEIKLAQTTKSITVSPFVLNATLNGTQFPKNGLTVNLQTDATLNSAAATLDISKLKGKIANLQFNGKLGGIDLFTSPTFNGNLTVSTFNPKTLLQTLGLSAPKFQNNTAFSDISLDTQFIMTPTTLAINNLKLKLDESTLTGSLDLALAKTTQSQFNLNIDKIDVSNYLPATQNAPAALQAQASAATPATSTAAAATQILPLQTLRQLNFTGNLAIGTLNYQKFQMTHVVLNMSANNGLLQFAPNTANLYQGQWQSNMAINAQTNTPVWQINEVVNNVQIAPLTQAFYGNTKYQVTGTGNIKSSLTSSGNTQAALIQNLNGSGQLALNNGIIKGINLGYQMDTAMALVNRQTPPAKPTANETPFGALTGSAKINNGLLTNNDLSLQSPALQVTGKGTVNLVNQQVHYQMASTAVQGQVDPKIYALQEKIGGSVPIKITGTFANLKVYPDMEVILKNIATAYVKQNTDKIKQAVDTQVQNLGKGLSKNLQSALKNGLGGLLK